MSKKHEVFIGKGKTSVPSVYDAYCKDKACV